MARTVPVLVAGLLTIGVVACSGDDSGTTSTSEEPGVLHVHGLGIDPADDELYVATHYGLFRLPADGEAERVGDSYQDTMGFTVVGPNQFLGSGHPDLQDNLPPLLGLIESDDAGVNWVPVSLLGEVDFHALSYVHDRVYGYDSTSGRFMVSSDRQTWDTRSQLDELLSFGVDPDDAEHIIATTAGGVLTSNDGGRTWNPLAAPPLAFLNWNEDGTLAAAGADEGVYSSTDQGATWTRDGDLPGLPEAFLATSDREFVVAVQELGIYDSSDGGANWTLRYRDPAQ